jgi:GTP cyclohydrolase I
VQENLTYQVADFLGSKLKPEGVAVVIRAEHLCMTIRGVQAPGTYTTTARMTGCFADHTKTAKTEFLTYINGSH